MPKLKKINFKLIDPLQDSEPYDIMSAVRAFHLELQEANIAIAWRKRLTPDKDNRLILGKCIKATDLQREFSHYDFIILLNEEVWKDSEFTDEKKAALMDHELCHATRCYDDQGNAQYDERRRAVWRTRKHDIEEFQEIVQRHGCYKKELERFAEALLRKRAEPLFEELSKAYPMETATLTVETEADAAAPLAPAAVMGGTHQKRKLRGDRGTVN